MLLAFPSPPQTLSNNPVLKDRQHKHDERSPWQLSPIDDLEAPGRAKPLLVGLLITLANVSYGASRRDLMDIYEELPGCHLNS